MWSKMPSWETAAVEKIKQRQCSAVNKMSWIRLCEPDCLNYTVSAHSLMHNAAANLFVLAYLFLSQAKPNTMIQLPPPPSSSPHVYAFWSQALSVITLIVTNPPDPVFWRPLGGSSNTSKSSCPFCGLCHCKKKKKASKRLEGNILKGQRYHLRRQ